MNENGFPLGRITHKDVWYNFRKIINHRDEQRLNSMLV